MSGSPGTKVATPNANDGQQPGPSNANITQTGCQPLPPMDPKGPCDDASLVALVQELQSGNAQLTIEISQLQAQLTALTQQLQGEMQERGFFENRLNGLNATIRNLDTTKLEIEMTKAQIAIDETIAFREARKPPATPPGLENMSQGSPGLPFDDLSFNSVDERNAVAADGARKAEALKQQEVAAAQAAAALQQQQGIMDVSQGSPKCGISFDKTPPRGQLQDVTQNSIAFSDMSFSPIRQQQQRTPSQQGTPAHYNILKNESGGIFDMTPGREPWQPGFEDISLDFGNVRPLGEILYESPRRSPVRPACFPVRSPGRSPVRSPNRSPNRVAPACSPGRSPNRSPVRPPQMPSPTSPRTPLVLSPNVMPARSPILSPPRPNAFRDQIVAAEAEELARLAQSIAAQREVQEQMLDSIDRMEASLARVDEELAETQAIRLANDPRVRGLQGLDDLSGLSQFADMSFGSNASSPGKCARRNVNQAMGGGQMLDDVSMGSNGLGFEDISFDADKEEMLRLAKRQGLDDMNMSGMSDVLGFEDISFNSDIARNMNAEFRAKEMAALNQQQGLDDITQGSIESCDISYTSPHRPMISPAGNVGIGDISFGGYPNMSFGSEGEFSPRRRLIQEQMNRSLPQANAPGIQDMSGGSGGFNFEDISFSPVRGNVNAPTPFRNQSPAPYQQILQGEDGGIFNMSMASDMFNFEDVSMDSPVGQQRTSTPVRGGGYRRPAPPAHRLQQNNYGYGSPGRTDGIQDVTQGSMGFEDLSFGSNNGSGGACQR